MVVKCNVCGRYRTYDHEGCRCAAGYSAAHHIAQKAGFRPLSPWETGDPGVQIKIAGDTKGVE